MEGFPLQEDFSPVQETLCLVPVVENAKPRRTLERTNAAVFVVVCPGPSPPQRGAAVPVSLSVGSVMLRLAQAAFTSTPCESLVVDETTHLITTESLSRVQKQVNALKSLCDRVKELSAAPPDLKDLEE